MSEILQSRLTTGSVLSLRGPASRSCGVESPGLDQLKLGYDENLTFGALLQLNVGVKAWAVILGPEQLSLADRTRERREFARTDNSQLVRDSPKKRNVCRKNRFRGR